MSRVIDTTTTPIDVLKFHYQCQCQQRGGFDFPLTCLELEIDWIELWWLWTIASYDFRGDIKANIVLSVKNVFRCTNWAIFDWVPAEE